MFGKVAAFELRYQLRNPLVWIAGGLFFLLTFASVTVDQVSIGGRGNTHVNSPYAISLTLITLGVFFLFVTTAFVANVVTRDDDTGFGPILRATRIRKSDYLFGRFTGAILACAVTYLFVPLAILLGSFMPWVDREKIGPFLPGSYLYAYVVWALPTLFFTGALFFALATATRSMMATYVGVVAILVLFFISRIVLSRLELHAAAAYLDPFGIGAFSDATRYFTPSQRNSIDPGFTAPIVLSRLLWIALGFVALAAAWGLFRTEARGARVARREAARTAAEPAPAEAGREPAAAAAPPAPARPSYGGAAAWSQFAARTRFEMGLVFRSPAFFVLLALGLLNAASRLSFLDGFYGSPLHPMTRLMVQGLRESFSIIPMIVAIYYSGELVWRDRERKVDEIVDSAPAPDWSFAVPKMAAIGLVLLALYLAGAVAAIVIQFVKGGATPDLAEYLGWYVVPEAVDAAQIAVLAVFVQALSPHKFVGWGVMVLILVSQLVFAALGLENYLYLYGDGPAAPLSDMNGQGYFGAVRWWYRAYWSGVAFVLAVLAYGLWRRGANIALTPRLRRLPFRLRGGALATLVVALAVAVGVGSFITWNTKVLNTYRTSKDEDRLLADEEKALLPFETLPQPKITDISMRVDLDPLHHQAVVHGAYVVRNKTDAPIRQMHLRFDPDLKVTAVSVEGGRPFKTYERFNYRIFTLDTPMAPGESRRVAFETVAGQPGFKNSGNTTRIVANGTFLNNFEVSPFVGMTREGLLQDRAKRRKFGLPAELRPPKLENEAARRFNVLRHDADWVNSDITVSTLADQTPIAPGYKVSDVTAGGRRTARFRSEAPINAFFSVQSARYLEKHVPYKGIDLAVYYDAHHPWNVDRMINALKAGLDRDQAAFSPYQFRQVRIIEFPDYAQFAQSFANTIPYSEGIGFLFKPPADPRTSDKIDMVTYVTAHELGHQWWAHQVISSDQQGATSLIETMAQYSALMTMEALYGPDQIRRFLKYELDRYLRGRGVDALEELPLERVENQQYIHYAKGSLVMYRLKDELGEATVDDSLRRLIGGFAFKAAPYPRSLEYLAGLKSEPAAASPAAQKLIADLWERITLYDLKANGASARRRPDGKWDVTLRFTAKKVYADGQGKETPTPLNGETMDVGVFTREPSKTGFTAKDVLAMQRVPVRDGAQSVTITVGAQPRFAGIDPYAKLIDRNTDDNLVPVAR